MEKYPITDEQSVVSGVTRQRGRPKWDNYAVIGNIEHNWTDADGGNASPGSTNLIGTVLTEVMYDKYKPYGLGIWPYGPCLHVKGEWINYAIPSSGQLTTCTSQKRVGYASYGRLYNVLTGAEPPEVSVEHFPIPSARKSQLISRFEHRLPTLTAPTDWALFLLELKDFKSAYKALLDFWPYVKAGGKMRRIVDTIMSALGKDVSLSVPQAIKILSNLQLSWSFALEPFIEGMRVIWGEMATWRARIQEVEEGLGKVHDLNCGLSYAVDVDSYDSIQGPWPSACQYADDYTINYQDDVSHRLTICAKYRYTMPESIWPAFDKVSRFLTATGLLPTIETAWNVIPFSFVLDWFLNTDILIDSIASATTDDNDISVELIDLCVTLKEEVESVGVSPWCHAVDDSHVDKMKLERFYRWVGEEAFDVLSWYIKSPSFMAVRLGVALIGASKRYGS